MAAKYCKPDKIKLVPIPKGLMRPDLIRRLPQTRNDRFLDLTGRKLERCRVVGFAGFLKANTIWLCRCNCGKMFLALTLSLANRPVACGCGAGRFKYRAVCHDPAYKGWQTMLKYHSERVCQRWRDYYKFREDVGPRPGAAYIIGRRDRRKDFGPSNAAWMLRSKTLQGKGAKYYMHAGKTLTVKEWAAKIGISYQAMWMRIGRCERHGANISEALTTPAGKSMPSTRGKVGRPRKKAT